MDRHRDPFVHRFATVYHPQTNGLNECLNRLLTDMLSMHVCKHHRDWDINLPFVTFAYNSTYHDTLGYPPFYVLFGRYPLLPLDSVLPVPASTSFYARDAISSADVACFVARHRLSASQDMQ